MQSYDNAMRRQVYSLPSLIEEQYRDLEPKTRKVLTTPEIFSVQRIVLTGCGDSHAAAMATKYTFERLTGIPTEVVPAIELARNYDERQLGFAPHNPLVIAVSNSGNVARVGEAIKRVVKHGAFALGITGNENSLLGESASRVLPLSVPQFESAPGTRSYLVSVLALLLMAIRIGEVRGRYTMDQAMAYRNDILRQGVLLEEMLPAMDASMYKLADKWRGMEAFDFIASGSDYAAAFYGHAKVFEAMGKYAMCVNTEEWLHLNFFMRRFDKIGTVVICNSENPALSRTAELVSHSAKDLDRSTLVVSDELAFPLNGAEHVAVPKSGFAQTGVLTQFVPLALLAGYIGEMIGEKDGRGCEGNWSFCTGGAAIKNSEIIVL